MNGPDHYKELIEQVVATMPVEATVQQLPTPENHDPTAVALFRIAAGDRSHDLYVALNEWADGEPWLLAQQERNFRSQVAAGIWVDLIEDPLPEAPDAEPSS